MTDHNPTLLISEADLIREMRRGGTRTVIWDSASESRTRWLDGRSSEGWIEFRLTEVVSFSVMRFQRTTVGFVHRDAPHRVDWSLVSTKDYSKAQWMGELLGFDGIDEHPQFTGRYAGGVATGVLQRRARDILSSVVFPMRPPELEDVGREVMRSSPYYVDPDAIPQAAVPASPRKRL